MSIEFVVRWRGCDSLFEVAAASSSIASLSTSDRSESKSLSRCAGFKLGQTYSGFGFVHLLGSAGDASVMYVQFSLQNRIKTDFTLAQKRVQLVPQRSVLKVLVLLCSSPFKTCTNSCLNRNPTFARLEHDLAPPHQSFFETVVHDQSVDCDWSSLANSERSPFSLHLGIFMP